jgi:hypothetical protein
MAGVRNAVCAIGLRLAVSLIPAAACAAQADERRPLVVVLATAQTPLQVERFLLALTLQLDPYRIATQRQAVGALPPLLEAQIATARARGEAAGALAVVWIVEPPAQSGEVVAHLLDLRDRQAAVQTLAMSRVAELERSLALAVRTLLLARPLVPAGAPASRAVARPPAVPRPAPRHERRAPLLQVGAGYVVESFPVGGDLRHGPEVSLAMELGRLRARAALGYRLAREGREGAAEWSRSAVALSALVAAALHRGRRLELSLGPRLGLGLLSTEARALDTGQSERATLHELSLGAEVAARLRLSRRFSVELGALVAGVPLGHRLVVRGREVSHSGGLELSVGAKVDAGFF